VIVPDDQLSLAIGRDGQNARLAARLTGWRVDIKSETEFAQEEDEIEYEGEEASDGHCMAVLANGRRCPNAAIGGSSYCGLPAHQALSRFETNQIAILAPLATGEIEILADTDADEGQVTEIVGRAEAEFVEEAEEEVAEEEASEEADEEALAEGAVEDAEAVEETESETVEEEAEDAEEAQVAVDDDETPADPGGEAEESAVDGEAVAAGPADDAESPQLEAEQEPVAEEAEQA
jgi:N utilization substance protein A